VTRALWVTALPPDRFGGGGHIRQAYLLEALARRAETKLLLAGHLTDGAVRAAMAEVEEIDAGLRPIPQSRTRRRLEQLAELIVTSEPNEVVRHAAVRRALEPAMADQRQYDVVCVEYMGLAPLLPPRRSNRWVLTLPNLGR
jgi:hypothetical protein